MFIFPLSSLGTLTTLIYAFMEYGIFYRPRHLLRATISLAIAVVIFGLSVTNNLDPVRVTLDNFTNKIFIFNKSANRFASQLSTNFKDVESLNNANQSLQQQLTALKFKVTSLEPLAKENQALRTLLGLKTTGISKLEIVNIINTEQGFKNNIIFIDKGLADGLFIGQNIFDPQGLVGQIIAVSEHQSRVLLITDINSYVPVYDQRTSETMFVHGTNNLNLELKYYHPKSQFQVGDVLYSSGAGNTYLANYPVVTIIKVNRDSNNRITYALAKPTANLTSLRYLVAVWPETYDRHGKATMQLHTTSDSLRTYVDMFSASTVQVMLRWQTIVNLALHLGKR